MHYLLALWFLVKFSQLIAFIVIRVSRWLIQILRDIFPAVDQWVEHDFKPAVQRLRETIRSALLTLLTLVLLPLILIAYGCFYIICQGLYLRDRREANDPETDPERLRQLGESMNPITRQAVISNPNTPTDVLLKLGEKFPKQLFANPIFGLLLLEDPNLLKTMPKDTLKSLLRLKEIPVGFLEQAANHYAGNEELMQVIAKHPNMPKYIFEKINQRN